jgi:HSP20 family molecular chaperone IbpA
MYSKLQTEILTPSVDIIERVGERVVIVDLPGADESSIEVSTENNLLTLTARVAAQPQEGMDLLYRGFELRDYRRAFTLPDDVDRQHITAKFKNGVLRVTLPKAAQARPRQVSVQVET